MVPVAAGLLTVVPAGGRVGGLLREPPVRVAVAVVVGFEVEVVEVDPGRRTVDDEVVLPGRFTAGAVAPSDLEPLATGFVADDFVVVDLGESLVAVPVVSSPERMDSSFWTTSNPSASEDIFGTAAAFLLFIDLR